LLQQRIVGGFELGMGDFAATGLVLDGIERYPVMLVD